MSTSWPGIVERHRTKPDAKDGAATYRRKMHTLEVKDDLDSKHYLSEREETREVTSGSQPLNLIDGPNYKMYMTVFYTPSVPRNSGRTLTIEIVIFAQPWRPSTISYYGAGVHITFGLA